MPVEMLTYAELGDRLKISAEAARALVKRHRLPRSRSNDGKTLVHIDLSEINHSPIPRAPQAAAAGQQVVTALKDHIATLQADLAEMRAIAGGHRADFERECDRTNKLLAELLKANLDMLAAREKAAGLEGKLEGKQELKEEIEQEAQSAVPAPSWGRRVIGAFATIPQQAASSVRESVGRLGKSQGGGRAA